MIGAGVADLLFDSAISGIWPLLLLPPLAAAMCDRSARRLPTANADWRVTAVLAGLPGLVLLVLIVAAAARSLAHAHPDDWSHFAQHHFIGFVAPLLLAPAIGKAIGRAREMARLKRSSRPPEQRLAAAAARVGIDCRQLAVPEAECFVAGIVSPTVYVSTAALAALGDSELDAALRHEQAHVAARDTSAYAVLAFLNDLAPANRRALAAYRQARERIADQRATQGGGELSLASALVALCRATARPVPCIASGEDGSWRIAALLGAEQSDRRPVRADVRILATLALLPWPALQTGFAYIFCTS